jgi:arginine N-succinyltransferase
LEAEGFAYQGSIDIFDGGPVLECPRHQIRAVRDSRVLSCAIGDVADDALPWLVANRDPVDYRVTLTRAVVSGDGAIMLPAAIIERMGLAVGAAVRAVPLKPLEKR